MRKAQVLATIIVVVLAAVVLLEVRPAAVEIAGHQGLPERSLWLRPTIFSGTAIVLLALVIGAIFPLIAAPEKRVVALHLVYLVLAIAALWTMHRLAVGVNAASSHGITWW